MQASLIVPPRQRWDASTSVSNWRDINVRRVSHRLPLSHPTVERSPSSYVQTAVLVTDFYGRRRLISASVPPSSTAAHGNGQRHTLRHDLICDGESAWSAAQCQWQCAKSLLHARIRLLLVVFVVREAIVIDLLAVHNIRLSDSPLLAIVMRTN